MKKYFVPIIFAALISTVSFSTMQASGVGCNSAGTGSWTDTSNWDCGIVPDNDDGAFISGPHKINLDDEINVLILEVNEGGELFIDCAGSLTVLESGFVAQPTSAIINHGFFEGNNNFQVIFLGVFNNGGTVQGISVFEGFFNEIPSICVVGGTVVPVDTVSLLAAGAQANMSWLTLAAAGVIAAGAGIAIKVKSKNNKN